MPTSKVLIVGESPSLGQSLADLMESAGLRSELVPAIDVLENGRSIGRTVPVVLVAGHGFHSETLRRWKGGDLNGSRIVVVGSRDPALAEARGVTRVDLPLDPGSLIDLVRGCVRAAERRLGGPV